MLRLGFTLPLSRISSAYMHGRGIFFSSEYRSLARVLCITHALVRMYTYIYIYRGVMVGRDRTGLSLKKKEEKEKQETNKEYSVKEFIDNTWHAAGSGD